MFSAGVPFILVSTFLVTLDEAEEIAFMHSHIVVSPPPVLSAASSFALDLIAFNVACNLPRSVRRCTVFVQGAPLPRAASLQALVLNTNGLSSAERPQHSVNQDLPLLQHPAQIIPYLHKRRKDNLILSQRASISIANFPSKFKRRSLLEDIDSGTARVQEDSNEVLLASALVDVSTTSIGTPNERALDGRDELCNLFVAGCCEEWIAFEFWQETGQLGRASGKMLRPRWCLEYDLVSVAVSYLQLRAPHLQKSLRQGRCPWQQVSL